MQATGNLGGVDRERTTGRRADWLVNSLISGFVAAFAMTVVIFAAYGLAHALGDQDGNQVQRWFHALHDNTLTRSTEDAVFLAIALNLAVGVFWALAYGYDADTRLSGPAWSKGMIFALGPWLLSILVFFPIMDAGIFGRDLGAGPLPVLGNLILHLVYGGVLGSLYAVDLESWLADTESDRDHNRHAERGAAVGILAGAPLGLIIGWFSAPALDDVASRPVVAVMGAMLGAALGLIVGSFAGYERAGKGWSARNDVPRQVP